MATRKKLSLSEAQLAASGMLPQQQDIMGDVPKKPAPVKKQATKEQAVKPKQLQPAKKATTPAAKGEQFTKSGHRKMTVDIALDILKRQAEAQEKGEKLDRKALSAEINIGIGTVADVLSGQPVIVSMLAKAGHTHPHPRDEHGSRVGVKRNKPALEGKVGK
jgi:hypothetical protein